MKNNIIEYILLGFLIWNVALTYRIADLTEENKQLIQQTQRDSSNQRVNFEALIALHREELQALYELHQRINSLEYQCYPQPTMPQSSVIIVP